MRSAHSKQINLIFLLAVCLAIALLNGCMFRQSTIKTESPAVTSNQPALTPTPGLTTTNRLEPVPDVFLPQAMAAVLGTGIRGETLLQKIGLDFAYLKPGLLSIRSAEDQSCIYDIMLQEHFGAVVVTSASIKDASGERMIFEPVPDKVNMDDFQIVSGSKKLDFNGSHTEDELIQIFGQNLQRQIETVKQSDGLGSIRKLTLKFQDIDISLYQLLDTTEPTRWGIGQITCRGAGFANPRGLCVGLSFPEIVKLFGTGDFNLSPDDLPEPAQLEIIKQDPVNDGEYMITTVNFAQGKATAFSFIFEGP